MEPASPLLPWEVIERVIGHSGDNRRSLINFSLTCSPLRPRALCLLVADVRLWRREQIFNFCDFLLAKPHLKPLVRSIAIDPDEFSPFPLLSILPNLAKLKFSPTKAIGPKYRTKTVLNRSSLTCCERFGTQIQALHIYNLFFATYLDFARVILTFKNLAELVCTRVVITSGGNRAHLDMLKRHFPAVHLRTVDINYLHLGTEYFCDRVSVANLLLDSGLVQSTVETLTVRPYRSHGLSYTFDWPRLRLLVLEPSFSATEIAATTVFLEGFPPSIQDVKVQFRDGFIKFFIETLSDEAVSGQLKELEQALLRFRHPRIACLIYAVNETSRDSFWIQEIGRHFPELLQRGAFTMTSSKGPVIPRAGHCLKVSDIATSPDGKWVATSSHDSTIILWRTTDGEIAKQWVAHSYKKVTSLAFSPDGQSLVSGGWDSKVKIWDVAEGSREAVTLEGHTKPVTCCAWSPCDDLVASGSDDQSVRLWDAHAFHGALHVLEHPDGHSIRIVAFSPDRSWLASGTLHGYRLWNTASGTLHKSLPDEFLTVYPYLAPARNQAVFDLRSGTRLLVTDSNRRVKVVDVETGEERAVLTDWSGAQGVSQISPDGTLVLTSFSDGRMMLLDAYTGVELSWLKGHEQPVRRACFSPCGKYVASLLKDNTIRLWRARDGSCMETFSSRDLILVAMGFSADGKTLWLGDSRGTVTMWRTRDVFQTEKRVL